jgi:hypothetical protein
MDIIKSEITVFPVFSILLSAAFVYFLLRVLAKFVPRLLKRKSLKSKFNRSFGFISLLVWIAYILLIIPKLYSVNFESGIIVSAVLLSILLIIAWFAGRDIVAGFILRSNSGFMLNAEIKTDEFDGVIVEFFSRNFKLINENGDKILIPYSQILGKSIRFTTQEKSRISKRIQIKIKTEMSFDKLKEVLRFQIMTHPKALISKVPVFSKANHENGVFELDILIFARDSQGLSDVEKSLHDYVDRTL